MTEGIVDVLLDEVPGRLADHQQTFCLITTDSGYRFKFIALLFNQVVEGAV